MRLPEGFTSRVVATTGQRVEGSDYVWHGIGMGMDYETEITEDITAFWPGIDAMVNCHLGLLNVLKSVPIYNEAGLHRNRHAGTVIPTSTAGDEHIAHLERVEPQIDQTDAQKAITAPFGKGNRLV